MKGRGRARGFALLLAAVEAGCASARAAAGARAETEAAAEAGTATDTATGAAADTVTAADADTVTGAAADTRKEAEASCLDDGDCGYDPAGDRCGSDPRYNRQPPIVDQGIVCYCEESRCAMLRVAPVPCEGDRDCAVRPDPRPHPVRASAARPHEAGRACRDFTLSTTCERTNICTMHRHRCGR